ncbi:MAG: hypothetical protein HDT23_03785 [Ruminococcus sp.]|nr:hypothetical protein [Ruminococcus sp.]
MKNLEERLNQLERRLYELEKQLDKAGSIKAEADCCKFCQHSETCEKSPEHVDFCECEEAYLKDVLENGSWMDDAHRFILEEYDDQ